ncbi:MAG: S41 family peptidase [Crocinitomicaceae bacterium]|nr:S41 family peptidase [Crocinitomicaceae bacterium]
MMSKIKSILSAGIVTLVIGFSNQAAAQSNGFEIIKGMELMDQIYEHLEKYFVDDIKAGNLSKTAIDAMLKELDPYTVYYHESNIEDYRLLTTGQYGGVGALIRKNGDFVYVAEPYKGKPAEMSGLKAGDKILEIDGKSMENKSSSEVSTALKGPKGTTVDVKIERQGSDVKMIKVDRDEIKLPDVPYSGLLKDKVGYIKLNGFTQTASTDVKKAFKELKEEGMESLVLDLRGNGGGLVIEAVRIVNMFVDRGQVVVSTIGRVEDENRVYKTTEDPMDLDIPLVVLMDGGSASASEIVGGSLQDLDRAVIIGSTSFGKGLVQRTYDLDYGSKVKLTIAKYYTPSGRCVQRLEYYDRGDGDRPKDIPDSLITIFKTKNGRDVIDGRGVEPDIDVEKKDFSRLTGTVFANNFVFDYATDYYYSHASITDASDFKLSDAEYAEFKKYVLEQEFTYSTASEEILKKMKEAAEEEGFYEGAEDEYDALLQKVVPSKERDLEKFKLELVELIENEIVSRYHFQRGRAEHAFNYDNDMDEAFKIFQNLKEYNTILGN